MKDYVGVDIGKRDIYLAWFDKVECIENTKQSLSNWLKKNKFAQNAAWVGVF